MKIIIFIIGIVLIGLLLFNTLAKGSEVKIIVSDEKVVNVDIEVADSPEERSRGLMFRDGLGKDKGMLFIFEKEDIYRFWMKNTKIPLDMIFISSGFRIVDILTAEPCEEDPCQSYASDENALYVLEVNSGYSERNGIKEGDRVNIYV